MGGLFEIDRKKETILEIERAASAIDFWNNPENAKEQMGKLNALKKAVNEWQALNKEVEELISLRQMYAEEGDESIDTEITFGAQSLAQRTLAIETILKLSGPHDKSNAIVSLHAGAGGTESCDWAQMLYRMYSRWAEKKGFQLELIDALSGDEAGLKSATFLIKGEYAYGFLQSELGVHRLVRISPFDANKRRHTSFASLDVIPEIDDDINIVIDEKDLKVDTYKASGAGGQHVNKTESAIRITHIPSGIIVACQTDRSQHKNRLTAMKLLKSKLYEAEQDKLRKSVEKHYNDKGSIEWGNQIRSYVFMPYQLVKDHRTEAETSQVDAVMDGDIDKFISAYLQWKLTK